MGIFIFLLPFGLVAQFKELGGDWLWLAVPFGVLVAWIFLMMELTGDYTENPFEGMPGDIPMKSLSRTIEIDLRQMIDDQNIPEPIGDIDNILM